MYKKPEIKPVKAQTVLCMAHITNCSGKNH